MGSAAARVKRGDPFTFVDPQTTVSGIGDNAMPELALEFVREKSVALSAWFQSLRSDWQPPAVAAHVPAGASLAFEFRGATPWSSTIDVADTRPCVQMRITFVANRATGAVPFVAGLELPVR